ncbi:MAG: 3-keto-disaccharide hydrolase [Aureliella sp.]
MKSIGSYWLRAVSLATQAAIIGLCISAASLAADDKDGPTYTDPDEAGQDYAIQGEFKGTIKGDEEHTWGAQVIALGKGKFRVVGYPGGLPGDGYLPSDETKSAEGSLSGDTVTFKVEEFEGKLSGDELAISRDGKTIGTLKRVHRKSATLGKRPSAEALVLFDGTTADHFVGGKMTDDDLLKADTYSKEKFGDHSLHIEFRTPFRPEARGQARGNSGVYVQSRYEVQVLDSFGLSGEDNECGGIYKIAKPKVNMCYPPLTWQTYDIDFVAAKYDDSGKKTRPAKITVRHNGVVIHEDLELKSGTPGRLPEGPSPEPLYLQGHGNPVVYRNIWVIQK